MLSKQHGYRAVDARKVDAIYHNLRARIRVIRAKNVVDVYQLTGTAKLAYAYVSSTIRSRADLQCITDIVSQTAHTRGVLRFSWRSFDVFLGNLPRLGLGHDIAYMLDKPTDEIVRETLAESMVNRQTRRGTGKYVHHLDVSYREHIQLYTKRSFDCFARGDGVYLVLEDGTQQLISICQYMFFIWVIKYDVSYFVEQMLQLTDTRSYRYIKTKLLQNISQQHVIHSGYTYGVVRDVVPPVLIALSPDHNTTTPLYMPTPIDTFPLLYPRSLRLEYVDMFISDHNPECDTY